MSAASLVVGAVRVGRAAHGAAVSNLGIPVQAAGGASRAQLYEIVEVALRLRTCRAL